MAENNKKLVLEETDYLSSNGIDVWVFGGWAEEINKVIELRLHKDIDLFYFSNDFELVDRFIRSEHLSEIKGKRFHHKRAFEYKGVVVELFLVEQDSRGSYTNFWGKKKYYCPSDIKDKIDGLNVILPNALEGYRRDYQQIDNLRKTLQ